MKLLKKLSVLCAVIFAGVMLTACVPSNLDKAKAKMEEAGYSVVAIDKSEEEAEGLVGGFIASKIALKDGDLGMMALLFDSKSSAKEYYEKWVEEDDQKEIIQKGKWVYSGTETSIEVFEG